jgi:hypothetical protein
MRYGRTLIMPPFIVVLATAMLRLTLPVAAQEEPKETQLRKHWRAKYLCSPESLAAT